MKFSAYALFGLLALGGCTSWFDSNQPYLQSSSNLIPGQRIIANNKTTAYALSKKYNVPMNDLIVLNRLASPFTIWPGQEVTLPASAKPAIPGSAPSNYVPTDRGVTANELPPPSNYISPGESASAALRNSPQQAVAPMGQNERFLWPVEGPILQQFGPRNSGGMNDGLNIAAPRGAPVMAAGNGVVLHAANDTKGFGNLILLRHGDGYITAYAHLDRMIVDKDSVVAKGDMIGTVGSTGDVKGPQLHFEVRKNNKPVDPLPLLPPQAEPNPY